MKINTHQKSLGIFLTMIGIIALAYFSLRQFDDFSLWQIDEKAGPNPKSIVDHAEPIDAFLTKLTEGDDSSKVLKLFGEPLRQVTAESLHNSTTPNAGLLPCDEFWSYRSEGKTIRIWITDDKVEYVGVH